MAGFHRHSQAQGARCAAGDRADARHCHAVEQVPSFLPSYQCQEVSHRGGAGEGDGIGLAPGENFPGTPPAGRRHHGAVGFYDIDARAASAQLARQQFPCARRARQQHTLAAPIPVAQRAQQAFGAKLFRNHVGANTATAERLGGRRPDGGHAAVRKSAHSLSLSFQPGEE